MPISLSSPTFWRDISRHLGTAQRDGALHYVVLDHTTEMRIIRRTREELFSSTVMREGAGLSVVVNGNYYDVSTAGISDALWGHDPVAAAETTILGRLINRGSILGGRSSPNMFYFGQRSMPWTGRYTSTFETDFGDPLPGSGMHAAIGGLGPLVVGGLRYGSGNRYRAGAPPSAPVTGRPGPAARPYLVQRNNNTFVSAESRATPTGKTILASCTAEHKILVAVQEDGISPGVTYTALRDTLARLGFDHAVFLDGSDSSTMMVSGGWVVRAAENKDETNVVGVGFT